ncbi:MAG: DUF6232 family protein [Pirellulales bacterium]
MSGGWFYSVMGVERGPVSSKELKRLADQGEILRDSLVRSARNDQWFSADRVKGLFPEVVVAEAGSVAESSASDIEATAVDVLGIAATKGFSSIATAEPKLISCPDCESLVSWRARQCPKCGCPIAPEVPEVLQRVTRHTERNIYENGRVKVTSTRFMIGRKTYAINGITSVKMVRTQPTTAAGIAVGILGAFFTLVGLSALRDGIDGIVGTIFGILMVAVGIYLACRTVYRVQIVSASGREKAYENPDEHFIQEVVDAINAAIAQRG